MKFIMNRIVISLFMLSFTNTLPLTIRGKNNDLEILKTTQELKGQSINIINISNCGSCKTNYAETESEKMSKKRKWTFISAAIIDSYLLFILIYEYLLLFFHEMNMIEYKTLKNANIQEGTAAAVVDVEGNEIVNFNREDAERMRKLKSKILVKRVCAIIPALPFVILFFIIFIIFSIPNLILTKDYRQFFEGFDEKQLNENGNLPNEFVITRKDIDEYVPQFNQSYVNNFDYLQPAKSFNKVLSIEEVKQLANAQGGMFVENIDEDSICLICLLPYEGENSRVVLFPCGHHLHFKCLSDYRRAQIIRFLSQMAEVKALKCFMCQLNLLKHYLYYMEQNYPKTVKYINRS